MQWLIDIIAAKVVDTIGLPPSFVDRGDPLIPDFFLAAPDFDSNWHDINLSPIVPAAGTAVLIRLVALPITAPSPLRLRPYGLLRPYTADVVYSQTPGQNIAHNILLPMPPSRIIQYWAITGSYTSAILTVAGWWK